MTLTAAQEAILALPFALNEHGFSGSNNVYIKKSAIRRRLSLVDPGWSQTPPVVVSQDDNTVALAATLTLCGSTRSGVGVSVVMRWNKDKTPMKDFSLALAILKAQKGADTDLLPRCAIQFNVGAYLKAEGVKDIKTEEALKDFLAKLPAPPPPPNAHWAANGGLERVGKFMENIGMKWKSINDLIEPGHTLSGLSETTLDEAAFMVELAKLAFRPAAPQTPPPAPPAPAPALAGPKTSDTPHYGVSSATTSAPVARPDEDIIDLNKYFAPTPTAAPAPADPLKNTYPGGAYNFRNTVRTPGSPTGRKQSITEFRIRPADLGEGDIFRDGNGPITTILQVLPAPAGTCLFRVREDDLNGNVAERELKMTASLNLVAICGGSKLDAVNLNPDLAPLSGSTGRLWVGEKNAQAAS